MSRIPTPTRRGLLGGGLALGAATAALGRTAHGAGADGIHILSTWDFGAAANRAAFAAMAAGGSPLDGVEAGARVPEADGANQSVGLGGFPDRDGVVTLDSVIMDDAGGLGAVAALTDTVHAVSVARSVMEHTPHTMLVGEGATRFARERGFPARDLLTEASRRAWREWLQDARYAPVANSENRAPRGSARDHDTIGILARGADGALAGACTTSGMAFKMHGRVGDSPIAGAGLFVERGVGAATATGVGEEVMRIAGSARVVGSLRAGMGPMAACREACEHLRKLRGDAARGLQVGFLALAADGQVGAWSLLPGFTYAVTGPDGITRIEQAASLG